MHTDELQVKGTVDVKVIDINTGKVIDHIQGENLVVTAGRQNIAKFLNNAAANKHVTQIAFGTNGTAAALGDVAPLTSQFAKAFGSASYPSANSVKFDWTLELAENNGVTIQELGMLCADNTLFARYTGFSVAKNNTIRLVGSWTFTF
jgi:hypothetical protein